jgi:hypothetical protein
MSKIQDEFNENLKLYRNIGKIYFNCYIAVKKLQNFDYEIPIISDSELDDISQAVVYCMNHIHEHGFEKQVEDVRETEQSFSPEEVETKA